MNVVRRLDELNLVDHPTYKDPGLIGKLGRVYTSPDTRFGGVYWVAQGPGRLLEQPREDELICILEGSAVVEWHFKKMEVGPKDVILWLIKDPPILFIPESLIAFCVTYNSKD